MKLREYCREKVEKEQAHTKVLQEQQRQRSLEEKKAREAALELKRQNEEREAELKRQAEEQETELRRQNEELEEKGAGEKGADELSPCDDDPQENGLQMEKNDEERGRVPNATVISSVSSESVKQVANGKQKSPMANEDGSIAEAVSSPESFL